MKRHIGKIIEILKQIRIVDDIELKDCAIDSLIDMLEELKGTNEKNKDNGSQ